MRTLVIEGSGASGTLAIRERPDPSYGPDEVRVRVRAAGLNRADVLQRRGLYPPPPGAPRDVPGLEFAGEIDACGAAVTAWQPGDRVMGIVGGGAHAERLVLHERMCLAVPPGLGFAEAAAIPEAYLTAFDALVVRGGMLPGSAVVVDAAGSGVGTAACLLALAAGARLVAMTRTASKRARLVDLGVSTVLDPNAPDLGRAVRGALGGYGAEIVIDFVGASAWARNIDFLAPLGRLVLIGTLGGTKVQADLGVLLRKRLTVVGTVLRSRPIEEKIALVRSFAQTALPLLAAGRLRAVVDRTYPLEEAARAHAAMERNENFGKIVLTLP